MRDVIAQIAAQLALERDAYARILELSREQLEAAATGGRAGGTERVIELLGRKQKIVDEIEGGAGAEARARWPELRDSLPPETRARLEGGGK